MVRDLKTLVQSCEEIASLIAAGLDPADTLSFHLAFGLRPSATDTHTSLGIFKYVFGAGRWLTKRRNEGYVVTMIGGSLYRLRSLPNTDLLQFCIITTRNDRFIPALDHFLPRAIIEGASGYRHVLSDDILASKEIPTRVVTVQWLTTRLILRFPLCACSTGRPLFLPEDLYFPWINHRYAALQSLLEHHYSLQEANRIKQPLIQVNETRCPQESICKLRFSIRFIGVEYLDSTSPTPVLYHDIIASFLV